MRDREGYKEYANCRAGLQRFYRMWPEGYMAHMRDDEKGKLRKMVYVHDDPTIGAYAEACGSLHEIIQRYRAKRQDYKDHLITWRDTRLAEWRRYVQEKGLFKRDSGYFSFGLDEPSVKGYGRYATLKAHISACSFAMRHRYLMPSPSQVILKVKFLGEDVEAIRHYAAEIGNWRRDDADITTCFIAAKGPVVGIGDTGKLALTNYRKRLSRAFTNRFANE